MWEGLLYTHVARVPLYSGTANMSRNGIESPDQLSSTINLMALSIEEERYTVKAEPQEFHDVLNSEFCPNGLSEVFYQMM